MVSVDRSGRYFYLRDCYNCVNVWLLSYKLYGLYIHETSSFTTFHSSNKFLRGSLHGPLLLSWNIFQYEVDYSVIPRGRRGYKANPANCIGIFCIKNCIGCGRFCPPAIVPFILIPWLYLEAGNAISTKVTQRRNNSGNWYEFF